MAADDLTTEGQLSALSAAVKADVDGKASTTHAADHATGGTDPLTPSQIGAVATVTGAVLVYKLQESSTPTSAGLPAGSLYMFVPDGTTGAL